MSFNEDQIAELNKPLDASKVKSRGQAGRQLSYIEGWHAIAEANRIFSFDGWTRETVECRCVAERERDIGKAPNSRPGWGVSYVARVRVVVFAGDSLVTREGVGSGHGIDVDLGQAHESAVKEAETDAMKRALMTFGWPFGLALYDKGRTHVETPETEEQRITRIGKSLKADLDGCKTEEAVLMWGENKAPEIEQLPDAWKKRLWELHDERLKTLKEAA